MCDSPLLCECHFLVWFGLCNCKDFCWEGGSFWTCPVSGSKLKRYSYCSPIPLCIQSWKTLTVKCGMLWCRIRDILGNLPGLPGYIQKQIFVIIVILFVPWWKRGVPLWGEEAVTVSFVQSCIPPTSLILWGIPNLHTCMGKNSQAVFMLFDFYGYEIHQPYVQWIAI